MQNRKQKENSYAKPNLTFEQRGTEGSHVFLPHITLAWMDKNKGVIWTKVFSLTGSEDLIHPQV